ncbi:MAG TPA: hypothetical protein PKA88_11855 [Polyangiaceae bacterium]|nr:hypothetical protein [Polyangiaceae bacterium]
MRRGVLALALASVGSQLVIGCSSDDGADASSRRQTEQLIGDLCVHLTGLPCEPDPDQATCVAGYMKQLDVALAADCLPLFDGWLQCLVVNDVACDAGTPAVQGCSDLAVDYRVCALGSKGCTGGGTSSGSNTTCTMLCGEVAANCEGGQGGPVVCTCANASASAHQFSAPECPASATLVLAECGGALL